MQIYDTLKQDHEEVKRLLLELISMNGKSDPHEIVAKIRDALIPHSRAEEAVFYNSLRTFSEAKDKIMHSFREHMEAETLLRTLQVKEKFTGDWKRTAKALKEALERHIEEEERQIFPMAERLLSVDETAMMGVAFEKYKAEAEEEGFMKHGLELIANLMPPRFTERFRNFQNSQRAS